MCLTIPEKLTDKRSIQAAKEAVSTYLHDIELHRPAAILALPVDKLLLSCRAAVGLEKANIKTVSDLLRIGAESLLVQPNVGPVTILEIRVELQRMGIGGF